VRLAPSLELALFRIVQEALTNCAKHASAKVVLVRLQLDSCPKLLSVLDDGAGFELEPQDGVLHSRGQGLRNMKETAEFVGGRFGLESVPGRGTRVFVEI
jgi:signal transduction histidine kinase